jgi:DNA recombination protein Rad52
MSFTDDQKKDLSAKLDARHVKTRDQAGQKLSYIEGWHAIAEANRIFGFDSWDRQLTAIRQLGEPREVSGKWRVAYMATVRITVTTPGGHEVVRDGSGFGSGIDRDVGAAHEGAIKEAETDAMKRALMTFGNPFGLALYDKAQAEVDRGETKHAQRQPPADDTPLDQIENPRDLVKRMVALIVQAPTLKAVNDLLLLWGDQPGKDEPKPDSLLAKLPDGGKWVRERAENRRGVLAQAPGKQAA